MARILAIIVTYNGMQWIDRCLGSVRDAGIDAFVVDNGSTDGTVGHIRDRFPEARLTVSKTNLGFGAANNLGFRAVLAEGYDYAYLLNQDAWLEKDTISILLSATAPEYGILSPIQTDAEGQLDKRFAKKCGRTLKSAQADSHGVKEVPFVMAAHWMVSRSAIEKVGGFSPVFTQYGEDDNWIHRAHYFGFKTGIVPGAKAVHDRADRKPSKEARMNLKCVSTVVKLSNPCNCLALRKAAEPLELLGMAVKNGSLIPVKYLTALLRRYPELTLARAESKQPGAFL